MRPLIVSTLLAVAASSCARLHDRALFVVCSSKFSDSTDDGRATLGVDRRVSISESEETMLPRRFIAAIVIASFVAPIAAVGSRKAEYVGGTVAGMPERIEGHFSTHDEHAIRFEPDKKRGPVLEIPYDAITGLEYGQKAGRRVAAGVLVTPWLLFSKKRKHFLTVSYNDKDGKEQAAVIELGKDIVRTSLTIIETRSGKEIEYQDDEARKNGRGGD